MGVPSLHITGYHYFNAPSVPRWVLRASKLAGVGIALGTSCGCPGGTVQGSKLPGIPIAVPTALPMAFPVPVPVAFPVAVPVELSRPPGYLLLLYLFLWLFTWEFHIC